jgi:type VI secretion system protein VasG
MIDSILTNTLLPSISSEFLTRMMEGKTIEKVHVSVADEEFVYAFE